MLSSAKFPLLCLGAMLVWSAASPAAAEEWKRPTAHGGEISLIPGTMGATFRITIPDVTVELSARRTARARA